MCLASRSGKAHELSKPCGQDESVNLTGAVMARCFTMLVALADADYPSFSLMRRDLHVRLPLTCTLHDMCTE